MARVARWAFLVLAVTFLTALFEPWFVRWLEFVGWYKDPAESMGTVVNWIARFIGPDAFPWAAGIVFGLGAGMWLDWFLRRLDRSRVTEAILAVNSTADVAFTNLSQLAAHIATVRAFQFTKEADEAQGRLDWAKQQIMPFIALFGGSDLEELLRWIRNPQEYVTQIQRYADKGHREALVEVCDAALRSLQDVMKTLKSTGELRIPLRQPSTAIETLSRH